jgi:methylase of polypeptide subunit release factors
MLPFSRDSRLCPHSSANVGRIREAFDRAEYTAPVILERLGAAEMPEFRQRIEALPQHLWSTRAGTPLDVLVRLFLLREPVSADAACRAVAPTSLRDWAEAGLLHVGRGKVRAAVEVVPYQGLLAAADWPEPPGVDGELVMGLAGTSRALAQLTVRRHMPRTLDLGTGCGLQALLAAAHSDRVWAADLNPRSLQMVRFNRQLNGLRNIRCLAGDLFEPARGLSFDLILCNPPFVIGPARGWLHTHSRRPADDLCRDIVRRAPEFLREGGYCQLVCSWAHVAGQDCSARLASWIEGTGCDAWVLRSCTEDAPTYARKRVADLGGAPRQAVRWFDEWIAYYERERIEAVSCGVMTLRRKVAGPNWFACDSLPEMRGPCGAAIEARFLRSDFLRSRRDDADLLACRVRPAEDLSWEVRHRLAPGGWTAAESRLWFTNGLSFGTNADRAVVEFLAGCEGERLLGDHLRRLAAAMGQEVSQLAPRFLQAVRVLVEAGYLLPTGNESAGVAATVNGTAGLTRYAATNELLTER